MATAETIVVGAGAAGAVIAARVTEASHREVLLLESGPDYPDPSDLPEDLADGRVNSLVHHDWKLKHRPTTQALAAFPFLGVGWSGVRRRSTPASHFEARHGITTSGPGWA